MNFSEDVKTEMKNKTGVLLINLGTPDSPSVGDVRSYLSQFLNDPRVIDIAWLLRKILVNLVIVPFRAPKSAKIYKQLWTVNGSPLYTAKVKNFLQAIRGDARSLPRHAIQNPSAQRAGRDGFARVIVVPLFPQYASASTGSAHEEVRVLSKWWVIPITFTSQYHDAPPLLGSCRKVESTIIQNLIISFSAMVYRRQVDKVYDAGVCADHNCENIG